MLYIRHSPFKNNIGILYLANYTGGGGNGGYAQKVNSSRAVGLKKGKCFTIWSIEKVGENWVFKKAFQNIANISTVHRFSQIFKGNLGC